LERRAMLRSNEAKTLRWMEGFKELSPSDTERASAQCHWRWYEPEERILPTPSPATATTACSATTNHNSRPSRWPNMPLPSKVRRHQHIIELHRNRVTSHGGPARPARPIGNGVCQGLEGLPACAQRFLDGDAGKAVIPAGDFN